MSVRIAKTVALGACAFAITAGTALVVMWGWFLSLLIVSGHVSTPDIPEGIRWTLFVLFNVSLGAVVVILPIAVTSWEGRRFGVSSTAALLAAALLMGVTATWFLKQLTMVNACLSGVEFPLGNGSYCGDSR